jgi:hypothetical protein
MTTPTNPVGGPKDPYDRTYERVESSRDQPRERRKEEAFDKKIGLAAYLLQLFRKSVDYFLELPKSAKSTEEAIKQNLLLLKACFQTLKIEDRSQDVDFLNQMGIIWRHALENALQLKKDAARETFKLLAKKIQHYPENYTHTFGYYLSENTNQKWVPFPYMELVQKIHVEHVKSPPSSPLEEWSLHIDKILSLLQVE